jgi:NAD(P)-dependent dehydrogenase (short-subunit alcohol dehydrogenase family)
LPETIPLAVVTGSAHRLGRAVAVGLAQAGYAIGMHYFRSSEAARVTEAELIAAGTPVISLPGDLTDESQIAAIFEIIKQQPYPLKVLVNSASIMPKGNLLTLETAQWDETLSLNLRAPWLCAKYAATLMKAAGGGNIINMSDAGVRHTWTGYPDYLVSKAGLEMLTRLLARTLAPTIRVNSVSPGLILPSESLTESDWQRLVDRLPLKKSGAAGDIVQAVLFILENQYMTGQNLVIDGGYQLV